MTIYKVDIECALKTDPWLVEMSDDEDPIFRFERDPRREYLDFDEMDVKTQEEIDYYFDPPARFNAWKIRERFFAIDKPKDALKFFREFGVWQFSRSPGDEPSNRFPISWSVNSRGKPLPVSFSNLMYLRNYFEDALNSKPSEWLRRTTIPTSDRVRHLELVWEVNYLSFSSEAGFDISILNLRNTAFPGPFKGEVLCFEIQDALRATVLLDWMEGREWPRCVDKDCGRVFKRTSKRPQLYCSARCASRVRQKEFRKRSK